MRLCSKITFFVAWVGMLLITPAVASEPILVRSQWRTENGNEPNISFFTRNENGFRISSGLNLKPEEIKFDPKSGSCVNLLRKLVPFSLRKMLERNFLTQEQFDFYSKFESNIDPSQIVFFNLAIPKTQTIEIKSLSLDPADPLGIQKQLDQTLMENFSVFGKDGLTDQEFLRESSKMLETRGSMWVVRNFKPGSKLPWELEGKFKFQLASPLSFELGRTAAEQTTDLLTLLKSATLTAANSVLSEKGSLDQSKIYVHAISAIHIRNYEKYGLKVIEKLENGEALMEVTVLDLYKVVQPLSDYAEVKQLISFFNQDSVKALQFRNYLRKSYYQFLDADSLGQTDPLILANRTDWHALMADEIAKLTDEQRNTLLFQTSATPDILTDLKIPSSFLNNQFPGNHVYGLDSKVFARNPEYLLRVIAGVYSQYIDQLNQGNFTKLLGQKLIHESPLVLFTQDPKMAEMAKNLGATIETWSEKKRTRKMSEEKITYLENQGFALIFENTLVKKITASLYVQNRIPKLILDRYQKQFLQMNGL